MHRAFVLSVLLAWGCGPSGTEQEDGKDAGGDRVVQSVIIEPANPTVVRINGTSAPVEFQVRATYDDGSTEITTGSWSFDAARIGAIGAQDGVFNASGVAAGLGNVQVAVSGQSATTTVTVKIEDEYRGTDVPADAPDRFGPPIAGAGTPTLLYPLDGAAMPTGLKPINIQWDVGAASDIYRVTLTAGLATVTAYVLHSGAAFDYAWPVSSDSWRAIKNSAGTDPVEVRVERWDSSDSSTYRSATHKLSMIEAKLDGAIYYWDLSLGKMLRITDAGREDFMPTPPSDPNTGSRCVACHTVSRDGRYLAAELWGGAKPGAIFDLSADLSIDPAPTVVAPPTFTALFSTFNPDASRLLINSATKLSLIDATTGTPLATTGLPDTGAAHPTWSPDGTQVAYIANIDGTWAVDFTLGDLAVLPVNGAGTDFGPSQTLRAAEGKANAWPSYSPDSKWIAFGRGTNSRGRNDNISAVYPGKLWFISRDGGAATELTAANGAGEDSYLPNFSPFDEGGYFWLAFYSTRDYGNAQVGTKGTGRRQLWVTAVRSGPQAGIDPSSVPFWLPDQDVASDNMSAYWVPPPPVD